MMRWGEEGGVGLEIEIIDPEAVILDDGSMEIMLVPDAEEADLAEFGANLADLWTRATCGSSQTTSWG
jgi:hypothetical protein